MTITLPQAAPAPATRRRTTVRAVAVVGLLVTTVVHVAVAASHVDEARYLLLLFDAFVLVSAALAAGLLVSDRPIVWSLALASCAAALVTYVVSRSVGLPLADDDIGAWSDPLGVVAAVAELAVVVAAGVSLTGKARRSRA
jgi:hypothetical protein